VDRYIDEYASEDSEGEEDSGGSGEYELDERREVEELRNSLMNKKQQKRLEFMDQDPENLQEYFSRYK
jgi:hypothetical protein